MSTLEIDGLSTPLRVVRLSGHEAISEAFRMELYITAEDAKLNFADTIGKNADLEFSLNPDAPRHIRGLIQRFEYLYHRSGQTTYRAILVPKAFRMMLRKNNRIFQGKTAPEIIEAVISGASVEEYTLALSGSYAAREYCVQYRESDWDFIQRLMEEEGIFHFFEHGADSTKWIIADSPSAYNPVEGDAMVKFHGGGLAVGEHIQHLYYGEELRSGKVTMRDYNFKTPKLSLETSAAAAVDDDLEVYAYPGNYENTGVGSGISQRRLDALQAARKTGEGKSNCPRLSPGRTFSVDDTGAEIARTDIAQEYVVTRVEHLGTDAHVEGTERPSYENRFWVVPSAVAYRPEPKTEKPRIFGVQTAIVTGPGGEEIHTDQHGRIKVQFFWDRQGKQDENSSCWVRVKQPWAGAAWGHLFLPRIGQEVVIEFIEGDPDRPLCSGAVYHAANVPPYPLPGEKTKSTMKTESSTGGGGYNELRFEDLKGSEEIYLQGEKDWTILIKNDKDQQIGHDETLDVGNDQTIHVAHDRDKTVDNDQSEKIGGNKTSEVAKDHSESIHQNQTLTVDGNVTQTVCGNRSTTINQADTETIALAQASTIGGAWSKTVGAAMALSVAGSKTEAVAGGSSENVGGEKSTNIGKSASINVAKNYTIGVGDDSNIDIGKNRTEKIGKNLTLTVGENIKVTCGKALITIKKDGNIKVEGADIIVEGKGNIKVKGKKVKVESDGTVEVKASGKIKVSGSEINLN